MKQRPLLLLLSLIAVVPLVYWLPSYGVLLAVSIITLLLFSLGISLMVATMSAVEKVATTTLRLVRRERSTATSGSLLHHS